MPMRAWIGAACLAAATFGACRAEDWPPLPEADATVALPAQEWPQHPGPRTITAIVHYPGGKRANVGRETGLMLSLHNWGGENCVGTADPKQLANRLNVVALCVNYLQSGKKASIDDPEPYDCGYLQALDALRSLGWMHNGLKASGIPFAQGRTFATGGSGGGNVTLMTNKLAPRTFACVVDLCGMKKLSHDVAFHFPGGSDLNARWSRDPKSPNYLSVDEQEIRFVGHSGHLAAMKALGHKGRTIVVHGREDRTCPFADAEEMVENIHAAGLDVQAWYVTPNKAAVANRGFVRDVPLDGVAFTSAGHSLGNRTEIVFRVAGDLLAPTGDKALRRDGPSDFDLRDDKVRYRTPNGEFVISYADGYPVGRFVPNPPPIPYDEHVDLTYYRYAAGAKHPIKSEQDWEIRRRHIAENLQLVMGRLPGVTSRVPLDVKVIEENSVGKLIRRKVSYQTDADDRVTAWLFIPAVTRPEEPDAPPLRFPAVLCLQQTTNAGKDEPAGLAGDPNLHYALHLAERGYVTLAPDYPSFGEHKYDFAPEHGYVSGSMKAVWDNIRSVDFLTSLPEVDAGRIGCIGHSLGGHNAIFTAVFEPRLKAVVSSCGFCRFHKDDVPSWTGPRYMPRIASVYGNSADKVPFDFPELIASFAPRPFLACAAVNDSDFDVQGVKETMQMARPAYAVFGKGGLLEEYYPEGGHGFPKDARDVAYQFLDRHLRPK